MTAKEMFEKLGYKLINWHTEPKNAKNYQFIYKNDDKNPRWIEFRKDKYGNCLYISHKELFNNIYDDVISIDVLQAINQQCKELEWIE